MLKLTTAQKKVLFTLTKPAPYKNRRYPVDAFNKRTLNVLENKGLVEFFDAPNYDNGAVRITELGKRILSKNETLLESYLRTR